MKFFVAFALIAAVASAAIIKPAQVTDEMAEIQEIIAAINSPSTNPATAAALEQMLQDLLGVSVGPAIVDIDTAPIAIGPAIVDTDVSPIAIGPAIVDTEAFPDVIGAGDISVGPAIIDFPIPVDAAPVASPASGSLVQIIINVNAAAAGGVVAESVVDPVEEIVDPVQIVDVAPIVDPIQIVDLMPVVDPIQIVDMTPVVDPVQIVDVMPTPVVEPVQIVDVAPVVVEPVQIGAPIIPSPAVSLPDELN